MNIALSPANPDSAVDPNYLVNHALACRLERAEAAANARFVEARAQLEPEVDARWIEVAGAYAMFDGVRSPCTQTFGLGLFKMPTESEINAIEKFFTERGAPVLHEVSPLADAALVPMLNERGYQPVEFTSVMFMPLVATTGQTVTESGVIQLHRKSSEGAHVSTKATPPKEIKSRDAAESSDHPTLSLQPRERQGWGNLVGSEDVGVRIINENEREVWARTASDGWQAETEFADLVFSLMKINASRAGGICFAAELEGQMVATGALAIHEGVALLAGASTLPQWRRRGAQRALLDARLKYAAQAGCYLAMFCAAPGGASQRNGERQGFRIAYTRIKFELKQGR